ncbi:MAG TPA: hypothetical protein VFN55_16260 [Solirubrobacteraceae bacterium]|nr:hypothetical protein [Solirubrobacteraceae bacterium]
MPKQTQAPDPGRLGAAASFDQRRREIAQRNEQASQKARKLRAERERAQVLARGRWELL